MVSTPFNFSDKYNIDYISSLEFSSEEILARIKRRAERKLRWKKHALTNRWTLSLFGHDIGRCINPDNFAIREINSLVGLGLFTTKKLSTLSYVGEYTGVVRKRKKRQDDLNDYVFGYVIGPHDTPWVIDAAVKGNFTRFINHSDDPNLTSRWMITPDQVAHILFFANRFIAAGEQLTYDYGPYYWRKRSHPQIL